MENRGLTFSIQRNLSKNACLFLLTYLQRSWLKIETGSGAKKIRRGDGKIHIYSPFCATYFQGETRDNILEIFQHKIGKFKQLNYWHTPVRLA